MSTMALASSMYRTVSDVTVSKCISPTEPLWGTVVTSTTAGPYGFFETDPQFQLKVKLNEFRRKYHQSRYLRVKYLPTNVTKQEVRYMLSDFPVSHMHVTTRAGTAGSASVWLEDPEMLEEWDKERVFLLRGQRIPVVPTPTENLLCIARLPPKFTDADFSKLVQQYGNVKHSFIMISEKTGESKSYGFVEYMSKDDALAAKKKLKSMTWFGSMLDCSGAPTAPSLWVDFLDPSLITFESLHSKCLYVSNLPPDYCDMSDFRRRMSVVVSPPYCQIAMKNGVPLNWGLVEFATAEDAEATVNRLSAVDQFGRIKKESKDDVAVIKGNRILVHFYIPGVRAIHLYMKLLEEEMRGSTNPGGGLLPLPQGAQIYETVHNLRKQNPVFALNVESIIVNERMVGNASGGGGGSGSATEEEDRLSAHSPHSTLSYQSGNSVQSASVRNPKSVSERRTPSPNHRTPPLPPLPPLPPSSADTDDGPAPKRRNVNPGSIHHKVNSQGSSGVSRSFRPNTTTQQSGEAVTQTTSPAQSENNPTNTSQSPNVVAVVDPLQNPIPPHYVFYPAPNAEQGIGWPYNQNIPGLPPNGLHLPTTTPGMLLPMAHPDSLLPPLPADPSILMAPTNFPPLWSVPPGLGNGPPMAYPFADAAFRAQQLTNNVFHSDLMNPLLQPGHRNPRNPFNVTIYNDLRNIDARVDARNLVDARNIDARNLVDARNIDARNQLMKQNNQLNSLQSGLFPEQQALDYQELIARQHLAQLLGVRQIEAQQQAYNQILAAQPGARDFSPQHIAANIQQLNTIMQNSNSRIPNFVPGVTNADSLSNHMLQNLNNGNGVTNSLLQSLIKGKGSSNGDGQERLVRDTGASQDTTPQVNGHTDKRQDDVQGYQVPDLRRLWEEAESNKRPIQFNALEGPWTPQANDTLPPVRGPIAPIGSNRTSNASKRSSMPEPYPSLPVLPKRPKK